MFKLPDGRIIQPDVSFELNDIVYLGGPRLLSPAERQALGIEDYTPVPEVVTPAPVVVPQSLTPLQARKALRQVGLFDQVKAYVDTLSDEQKEEWEYALEIRRDNPILVQGAALMTPPLTEEDLDNLFILGATLT